jgi:hypothetical protein
MKDITFQASLDGAKFIARNQEATIVRRVQFKLQRSFDLEQAEWLDAEPLRGKLQRGELDAFEIPIDAYHAKASFHGLAGNATAQVDGVSAAAKMSSGDEPRPMLALTFEAFPDAALLTWLAASVKEHVEVELLALQGDLLETATSPAGFSSPGIKTTTVPIEYPRQTEIPGAGKAKRPAKKRKGRR